MRSRDLWPPGGDEGREHVPAAAHFTTPDTATPDRPQGHVHSKRPPGQCGADMVAENCETPFRNSSSSGAGWRRRRYASRRLPPLACGCRDLPCRCQRAAPSERMVDAGRAAAVHLLGHGLTPILDRDVLRALWRRGGHDRRLAQDLYALVGGD